MPASSYRPLVAMIALTCLVCRGVRICAPLCRQKPSLARKQKARARSTQLMRSAQ
ncbi:hypothetical protein D3C71_1888980 [compost metagenome]